MVLLMPSATLAMFVLLLRLNSPLAAAPMVPGRPSLPTPPE